MPGDLNREHGVAGGVRFERGNGGLIRAVLSTPASEAHVYLHGAHVTHFAIAAQAPVLFLSSQSLFQPERAIRGGVPICFPWFGPRNPDPAGNSPMHGFARIRPWKVESSGAAADRSVIRLSLADDEQTRRLWPHAFVAEYEVGLGPDRLELALTIRSRGETPLEFEEALHSYFAVAEVRDCVVEGLDGVEYLDKTDNFAPKIQTGDLTIAGETDRICLNTTGPCAIVDRGNRRRIMNEKENSHATVVWNPWVAKAKAMTDFGDDEWPRMVCVETCNVAPHAAVTLAPGAVHRMGTVIRCEALD
jgi:glucose-6-phosphate 1-epimerase